MAVENISSLVEVSLENSHFKYKSQFDVGLHFRRLKDCVIENIHGTHIILMDSIDITQNVTFIPSYTNFMGESTIANAWSQDNLFHSYSHLIVDMAYHKYFEAERITLRSGSFLAAYNSIFHKYNRLNITMDVKLEGVPFMLALRPSGIVPKLAVEVTRTFIQEIHKNETREYFQYGIPIGLSLIGENRLSANDWSIDPVVREPKGEKFTTDEFIVTTARSNDSFVEYLELYQGNVVDFIESNYKYPTLKWTIASVVALSILVVPLLIVIPLIIIKCVRKNKIEKASGASELYFSMTSQL